MLECLCLVTNFIIAPIFPLAKLTTYMSQLCSSRPRPYPVLEAPSEAVLPTSWRNHGLVLTTTVRMTSARRFRGFYEDNVHRPLGKKISFPLSHEVGVYSTDLIARVEEQRRRKR